MSIPLRDVKMIQLFLRADGSVKGMSFNYEDSDVVDFGCCEAEPGCWYMWEWPQWLLFRAAQGRTVSRSRGFIPIEEIGFADTDMDDYPDTKIIPIHMWKPLTFRLSKKELELDLWFDERFCRRTLQ